MSIWRAIAELEEKFEPGVLCTIIHSQGSTPRHVGSKMLVYADGSILGSVGGGELEARIIAAALESISDGNPRRLPFNMSDPAQGDPGLCGGQVEVYMEPIIPKPALVIVGAGHVGRAVAHLAHWLDFRVVVSDDRPEFCDPEMFPEVEEFFPLPFEQLSDHLRITPWTYFVLTTRSVDIDVPGLPNILASPAAFIGVIGSKRRWQTTRTQLEALGVAEDQLARVQSPMGIEINAETPEEIAVSIMAEIIRIRHKNG
ncbi:MAG: XdhC family protein [Chloroflexota bacterium]|nr:MAG: XdhC family protein [Chloroflexota bacterium]